MHKYKINFKMADGSAVYGESTSNLNLEQYAQKLANSDRHIFLDSNGVQATVVNMRYVTGLEIREVWS